MFLVQNTNPFSNNLSEDDSTGDIGPGMKALKPMQAQMAIEGMLLDFLQILSGSRNCALFVSVRK